MNLADLSIRRPIFISCVVILMLVVGSLALLRLPVDLFPNVTFPVVAVSTLYRGAGPKEIETLVSKPIEDELSTLPGLKTLRSINTEGLSTVVAEFTLETDIKYSEQLVRDRISSAKHKLPDDIVEPIIRRIDPADMPIIQVALSADLPKGKLFDVADQLVRPKLEQVPQVGLIEIIGGRKREIHVELDRAKLRAHEISATRVADRIKASGQDVPAGKYNSAEKETIYRTLGEFHSLKDIGEVIVSFFGNDVPTRVSQLGEVTDTLVDETSRSFVNGKPALTLLIYRQTGANTIAVVDAVKARIAKMNDELKLAEGKPALQVVHDDAKRIRANVDDVRESILIGILLTIVVVYFFLKSMRSTIITALALPNSLIGAFILMAIAGFTVNIMTLLALSLAVGLLIDDAIVVRENIFRHMEMGKDPQTAAREGTREVTLAVIATTMTVIAVFGPIGFLQGIVGQFFREFGLTVCFAMAISLFDALTIAPMLSAYFAGGGHQGHAGPVSGKKGLLQRALDGFDRFQGWLEDKYEVVLGWVLRKPFPSLGIATGIFILSIVVLKWVPKTFIPPNDAGEFAVSLELPPGASLDAMAKVATGADEIIRGNKEVSLTTITVGSNNGPNESSIFISMVPSRDRRISTSDFKDVIRKQLKPLAYANPIVKDTGGARSGRQFNLNIVGTDLAQIQQVSKDVFGKLKSNPALKDPDLSYRPGKPEIQVALDARAAERAGISSMIMGQELRNQIEGVVPAEYREDGKEYDIRVRMKDDQRELSTAFGDIMIPNINGSLIHLPEVAKPITTEGPASINRQDRARYVQISADIAPGSAGMAQAIKDAKKIMEETKLPPGVYYAFDGQAQDFAELMVNMMIAMGLGILFIYLVLASLYESFITPLTIMLVLPLAACGAFLALFITRTSLDIFSMIGCIMLLGIATKNSILLVDYTKQLTAEGMDQKLAIIKAGRTRLRPILMTTIALIAGMLPVAIGLNEASKQRTSMGIAIIGGLISSTVLTLVVVPAAYSFIERFRLFLGRIGARITGATSAVKPGVTLVLLASLGLAVPQRAKAEALTLDQAVSQALANNPVVRTAQARTEEVAAKKAETISAILPRVNGNVNVMERQDAFNANALIFGGEPYNFYDVSLQAVQPIFEGGAFWNSLAAVKKEVSIRDLELEIARETVSEQVIESFYSLLLQQNRLQAMQKMQKIQEELLATARRRLKMGFGKELEVLQAAARLSMTQPEIVKAQIQLKISAAQLAKLMNAPDADQIQVTGSLEPLPYQQVRQAMKDRPVRRPEIERAELERDMADDTRSAQLADHWPKLNLVGSIGRNATQKSDLLDGNRTSWAFGLQLSIPIFSGLSSFHQRRELASRVNQADLAAQQIRENLAVEQIQTAQELEVSQALMDSTRLALDDSEKALQAARRYFGNGTVTFQQVSDAQRDAIQAELSFQQAQYDHISKLARYFVASGWPLGDLIAFLKDKSNKT